MSPHNEIFISMSVEVITPSLKIIPSGEKPSHEKCFEMSNAGVTSCSWFN